MILTITPNPTIDRVMFVRDFRLGAVVRGEREVVTPSGKGVDESLVIHELGGETVAVGLSAGFNGQLLTSLLDEWGIHHDFVSAHGETRTCVVLVDRAVGQQSSISAPTLRATGEHLAQLLALLDRYAEQAWGLICAGSLPAGFPVDSYARLLRRARERGLTTLLDSSGAALREGMAGLPHILKVNCNELAALDPEIARPRDAPAGMPNLAEGGGFGNPPRACREVLKTAGRQGDADDIAGLADQLTARLGAWVSDALIVTLGERGALAVTAEGRYHAQPPQVPLVNTAGAGDALGAGVMLARSRGADWPAALSLGAAAAASVVMNEGTGICRREQVEELLPQVRITRVA